MSMIYMEDIDEENSSSDDLEDYTDSSNDDSDDDDYGDDRDDNDNGEEWPDVDSNGEIILTEDYLIRSCSYTFRSLKGYINRLDKFLQSDTSETDDSLEDAKEILSFVQGTLELANSNVDLLLSRFSQSSKIETILQILAHATAEVAAIKAEFHALG